MADKAYLILEDGAIFEGTAFGAAVEVVGEVVFNTSMTGYQEMLTDPSYGGQIVMPTYPLIGNYGINADDFESRRIQVRGFIVREDCEEPSHYQSERTLHEYLLAQGVPGIAGADTRAVTRRLRTRGVMMGMVTRDAPDAALKRLQNAPRYGNTDFVKLVTTEAPYAWKEPPHGEAPPLSITVVDMGVKYNILRNLQSRGCRVRVVPSTTSAEDILSTGPDGVLLSPGPGDPALLGYAIQSARGIIGKLPIFGICLGHQVLGHAFGGTTFKLKFGHRGGNHPVKDLKTGRVYITAQNHGYAVDGDTAPRGVEITHINLNDGTVEGLRHKDLPVMSIQYHSEAAPGPLDNVEMFDRFVEMVRAEGGGRRAKRK
ncbi:MAG: glutamine-hydrolyzing carbamoyl-phosphate synthase small subunit [Chloroflexi bacterium]|nr:glutamine-hydrolyzing carbamoyl-phosphate synthase small subunit [Chloroflexota bacterium]